MRTTDFLPEKNLPAFLTSSTLSPSILVNFSCPSSEDSFPHHHLSPSHFTPTLTWKPLTVSNWGVCTQSFTSLQSQSPITTCKKKGHCYFTQSTYKTCITVISAHLLCHCSSAANKTHYPLSVLPIHSLSVPIHNSRIMYNQLHTSNWGPDHPRWGFILW